MVDGDPKRKGDDIGITEGVDSNNGDSTDMLNLGQRLRRIPTGNISLLRLGLLQQSNIFCLELKVEQMTKKGFGGW